MYRRLFFMMIFGSDAVERDGGVSEQSGAIADVERRGGEGDCVVYVYWKGEHYGR